MSHRKSDAPAFTLIELLVVIAIIGALVGILMPALGRARSNSKRTACASNLRQVGIGLRSYLDGNGDIFPAASLLPSVSPLPVAGSTPIFIADVLSQHLGGAKDAFRCPNDTEGAAYDPTATTPRTQTYFDTEKSSYEYRSFRLAGQTMAQVVKDMADHSGITFADNTIWLMRDYFNFHAAAGQTGSRRYLFYDNHVTDFENN